MGESRRKLEFRDGVARTAIFDPDAERMTIKSSMDVEPILDSIARDREIMRHGVNKLVARIPVPIVEDLINRGVYHDEDAFKAWLNSAEAKPWRIWYGRI